MAGASYMPTEAVALTVSAFEDSEMISSMQFRIGPMPESRADGVIKLLDGQLSTSSQVPCRAIAA